MAAETASVTPQAAATPRSSTATDSMEVDSDNDLNEDIEQDIERFRNRNKAARTIYRQARGDDDTVNSTRSLYDTDVEYHELHGRRYCKDYYMPNDEDEQTRMNMLHVVHLYLLQGRLSTVPLQSPSKILDVGTGSGDWVIAMGEQYPEAEVTGTDIAHIQPSAVTENVFFEIDDAEEEGGWTYAEDTFDLIHFRTMMGAFKDWRRIFKEAYRALKPGGWIEVKDYDDHKAMRSFFPPGTQLQRYLDDINEGSRKSGRPRTIKHLEHESFTEAGFVDVSTEEHNIPMGVWPEDKQEKATGHLFLLAQLHGIEALCLRVLSEQMGWEYDEIQRMCKMVSTELKVVAKDAERAKGLGFLVKIVKARKPFPGEAGHDEESVGTARGTSSV